MLMINIIIQNKYKQLLGIKTITVVPKAAMPNKP